MSRLLLSWLLVVGLVAAMPMVLTADDKDKVEDKKDDKAEEKKDDKKAETHKDKKEEAKVVTTVVTENKWATITDVMVPVVPVILLVVIAMVYAKLRGDIARLEEMISKGSGGGS
jgi:hypothetical protein